DPTNPEAPTFQVMNCPAAAPNGPPGWYWDPGSFSTPSGGESGLPGVNYPPTPPPSKPPKIDPYFANAFDEALTRGDPLAKCVADASGVSPGTNDPIASLLSSAGQVATAVEAVNSMFVATDAGILGRALSGNGSLATNAAYRLYGNAGRTLFL